MTRVFSWQNSVSLCPASCCTAMPNFPVTTGRSSYFCIPVPHNEKAIFFCVLVLEGLVGLHRMVQLQLLQHYWSGYRLELLWYWRVTPMSIINLNFLVNCHFQENLELLLSWNEKYDFCNKCIFDAPRNFIISIFDQS